MAYLAAYMQSMRRRRLGERIAVCSMLSRRWQVVEQQYSIVCSFVRQCEEWCVEPDGSVSGGRASCEGIMAMGCWRTDERTDVGSFLIRFRSSSV